MIGVKTKNLRAPRPAVRATEYPFRVASGSDYAGAMLHQWRSERPDLDLAGMGIVLRISLLAGVFAERLKATLAPAGLAPFEFDVLSALRRAGRGAGVSATELCESAQLTSGAMTHRLDRLEERGLVRRRAGREDRRSISVVLTAKGLALVDRVLEARMEDAAECVRALDRSDRRDLNRLLESLGRSLERAED